MKTDSTIFQLPKNIMQFSLGAVLFFITFRSFPIAFFPALLAFLLIYTAVYRLNDLADFSEDSKRELKRQLKALARQDISAESAAIQACLFSTLGIIISSFISRAFLLLCLGILALNLLYSSRLTRFKKRQFLALPTLAAIQFLKYSAGWFALTESPLQFPILLIAGISVFYSALFIYYKNIESEVLENRHLLKLFGAVFLVGAAIYTAAFFHYSLKLPMLLIPLFSVAILEVIKKQSYELRWRYFILSTNLVLAATIISFAVLLIPSLAEANLFLDKLMPL